MDSHFLLQEILSIHGLHPCLLHCRQIHYYWATSSTHTYTHTDTPHFLHSSIYGHLGCVSVLAVVNSAAWCFKVWMIQWHLVPNISFSFLHTHTHTHTQITRLPHQKFYFLCAFGFSVLFKLYLNFFEWHASARNCGDRKRYRIREWLYNFLRCATDSTKQVSKKSLHLGRS